jgi:hypothetical protein
MKFRFFFQLLVVFILNAIYSCEARFETQSEAISKEKPVVKPVLDIFNLDDYSLWPFPPISDLYIIYNVYYLKRFFELDIIQNDRLVVAIYSVDIEMDSYLPLYLGYLNYLFESIYPNKVTFVIFEPKNWDKTQTAIYFLSLLPQKAVFITFQHGPSTIGIDTLQELFQMNIYPNIVYHLNHEQPWVLDQTENSLDYTFTSTEELIQAYSSFPLVFRNYYYEPLLSSSAYLPINPPYYSFILSNSSSSSSSWSEYQSLSASKRNILCSFRGRTNYSSEYYSNNPDSSLLSESDQDRMEILSLSSSGQLSHCQFFEKNIHSPGQYQSMIVPYIDYMTLIVQSAFVLCPSGNNPETFRLREVNLFFVFTIILIIFFFSFVSFY